MPKTDLKQQLPTEKLSAAIDYLTYLYDKAGRLKNWNDVRHDV